jgi:hypothetical protein
MSKPRRVANQPRACFFIGQGPQISALLALLEFHALRQFLENWKVDIAQLQAQIAQLITQARGGE